MTYNLMPSGISNALVILSYSRRVSAAGFFLRPEFAAGASIIASIIMTDGFQAPRTVRLFAVIAVIVTLRPVHETEVFSGGCSPRDQLISNWSDPDAFHSS